MELRIDEQGQEQKRHGTYGFPVYLDRKWLSSYVTGGFPWHWHREIELTLVLEGAMEYRVNDSRYQLRRGRASSATPTPSTPAASSPARTATTCPSPSTPGCSGGSRAACWAPNTWTPW